MASELARIPDLDQREERALERGLRALGYDPSDFRVRVAEIPLSPAEATRPLTLPVGRKSVVVTRASASFDFRLETYRDVPWAGEVLLALISSSGL
jgi:hypothetical protein